MKRVKKQPKKMNKIALYSLSFSVLVMVLFIGLKISQAAWQEPVSVPVTNNVPAPISLDDLNEAKAGGLRIDPSGSLNMRDVDVKLDVVGEMRVNGTSMAVGGTLQADTNTLTVANNSVGMGTAANSAYKLSVVGGLVRVGSDTSLISGIGVYSASSNNIGIQASVNVANLAAVYGENALATGVGYGVYGKNTGAGIGVYGYSASGTGVYAYTTTTNSNIAALKGENTQTAGSYWAGYFAGRLESTNEVIGSKFLPTKLQNSLVPYTAGWKVGEYSVGGDLVNDINPRNLAFDGTYIWTANYASNAHSISKIRATDGQYLYKINVGTTPKDITYDGNYIWSAYKTVVGGGEVAKIDPSDQANPVASTYNVYGDPDSIIYTFAGTDSYIWVSTYDKLTRIRYSDQSSTTCSGFNAAFRPKGLAFDGQYIWVVDNGNNQLYKIDNTCNIIQTVPQAPDITKMRNPENIIFDGTYLWVTNKTSAGGTTAGSVTKIEASTGTIVGRYDTGVNDIFDLAFDGTFIWVTHYGGTAVRMLAVDPSNKSNYSIGSNLRGIIFDGTYLWVGHVGDANTIYKLYSGTGYGHTDLSSLVNLQTSTPGTAQTGNFSTSGTGTIDTNLEVGGDLIVNGNTWGGSGDKEIPVSGDGNYTCEYGKNTAGLWHFDENTGLTAYDSTANGNNGTLTNGPVWVTGKISSGIQFDGTDDYVNAGIDASLNFNGAITVEAWVKTYDTSLNCDGGANPDFNCQGIIDKFHWDGVNFSGFYMRIWKNFQFLVGDGTSTYYFVEADPAPYIGKWTHLVGVVDPSENKIKLYINGDLKQEATGYYTTTTVDKDLLLGRTGGAANNLFWNGSIDEVQVSNRAKGLTEIQADYNVDFRSQGSFIKGIEVDASGNLSKILCRPL